jgi:uncharacterized RDD family membrane protein YckC
VITSRVVDRIAARVAESGEIERLVTAALASPRTLQLTDEVLASDVTQHALRHVTSSPELREAITEQTAGLAEEMAGGVRAAATRLDGRAERLVRRPARAERPAFAGVATRALALSIDALITLVMFMSVVGMASLLSLLVGELRPDWLVAILLASGWGLMSGAYFVLFWSTVGQTPGMRMLRVRVQRSSGDGIAIWRSVVRLLGIVISIIPLFAGFLPVLFTDRRRGLADFIAGTVVVYDDSVSK